MTGNPNSSGSAKAPAVLAPWPGPYGGLARLSVVVPPVIGFLVTVPP